jgi:hypothetical protein
MSQSTTTFSLAAFMSAVAPAAPKKRLPVEYFVDPVESKDGGYRLHLGISTANPDTDGQADLDRTRADFYSKLIFTGADSLARATRAAQVEREAYRSGSRVPNPAHWEAGRPRTPRTSTRASDFSLDAYVKSMTDGAVTPE